MVERIRTLLETRQLTPTQFADIIGVARPIVSHILSGRNKPSLEVVQRILAAMPDLAMPWLLNGTAPMLMTEAAAPAQAGAQVVISAPQGEAAVVVEVAVPLLTAPASPGSAPAGHSAAALPAPVGLATPPATVPTSASAVVSTAQSLAAARQTVASSAAGSRMTGAEHPFFAAKKFAVNALKAVAKPVILTSGQELIQPLPTVQGVPAAVVSVEATTVAQAVEPIMPPILGPEVTANTSAQVPVGPVADNLVSSLTSALAAGVEKPIRRIVIFYRDGSFADYQPE